MALSRDVDSSTWKVVAGTNDKNEVVAGDFVWFVRCFLICRATSEHTFDKWASAGLQSSLLVLVPAVLQRENKLQTYMFVVYMFLCNLPKPSMHVESKLHAE